MSSSRRGSHIPARISGTSHRTVTRAPRQSDRNSMRVTTSPIFSTTGTCENGLVNNVNGDFHIHHDQKQATEEVYRWLDAPDSSGNYHAARDKHQSQTGSWFLDGQEYREWKKVPDRPLWLSGDPGCGKTIICSSAIEDIERLCEQTSDVGLAYFFFDGRSGQVELASYEKMIRSLISQLSDQKNEVPNALMQIYGKGRKQTSVRSLEGALRAIIEEFDQTFIVIDALDECAQREKLLEWVDSLSLRGSGKLHFFLASRQEPEIENHLGSIESLLRVKFGQDTANDDIRAYIEAKVSKMKKWDVALRQTVTITLFQGAGGMFRWVDLQFQELAKCLSLQDLDNQLRSLPKSLEESYERILLRSSKPADLKTFLQWMAFSVRPLTLSEIADIISVDFSSGELPIYNPRLRYMDVQDVLTICSGFVTEFEGNVKLAHMSVKDYLVSDSIKDGESARFGIDQNVAHAVICQTCLVNLLQFDTLGSLARVTDGSFSLVRYAAEHWIYHLHEAEEVLHDISQMLAFRLFSPSSESFRNWIRLYDPDIGTWKRNDPERPGDDIPSPVIYAALTGHRDVVQMLLDGGADVNARGSFYQSPLQAASQAGSEPTLRLLLERGAEVNEGQGARRFALQEAALRGYNDIVQLLIKHGADVNSIDEVGRTALQEASCYGHNTTIHILLDAGANPNYVDGSFRMLLPTLKSDSDEEELMRERMEDRTALRLALRSGHVETVKLLLERGADANIIDTGQHQYTALARASLGGQVDAVKAFTDPRVALNARTMMQALECAALARHGAVIKLLLKRAKDMDDQGGDLYGHALRVASRSGQEDLVSLLVEAGADVISKFSEEPSNLGKDLLTQLLQGPYVNQNGHVQATHWQVLLRGTPLHEACTGGHEKIVRFLIAKGANVNVTAGMHGSALSAASAEGHKQIVELLLDEGADVNAQSLCISTPALQAASQGGHIQIVKLLLERGADVNAQGGFLEELTALQALRRGQSWLEKNAEDGANLREIEALLLANGAT